MEKILFVDDEPNILVSFRRHFRRFYSVFTAAGAQEGLKVMQQDGPFAVVVSDLRMPGIDGIKFLSQVRTLYPDTVRVMLTGNADIQAAIEAVNQGAIFRFLNKPCPPNIMQQTLDAAAEQYRLVTAERVLLGQTLNGSVKVMVEMLSLINPDVFSQSSRIKGYVRNVVARLELPDSWQYELAAMLSQIGCIALPAEIMAKVNSGSPLESGEEELYKKYPLIGSKLIAHIPRLDQVARIIERQQDNAVEVLLDPIDPGKAGGQILKGCTAYDRLRARALTHDEALAELRRLPTEYDPAVVAALDALKHHQGKTELMKLKLAQLRPTMVLEQNICAPNGLLLVPKGQEVTKPLLERLQSYKQSIGVAEPIAVLVPVESEGESEA